MAPRIFPDCFKCERPFELEEDGRGRQYIYCPFCREAIRREREAEVSQQIRAQIDALPWPDEIGG